MEHWVLFVIISVIVYFMFFNKKENWGVLPNPETHFVREPIIDPITGLCVRYPDYPYECMYIGDTISNDDWFYA